MGSGADRVAGHASLILALMGEQGSVVGVAQGVEPVAVDATDQTGVVDIEPGSRREADRLESDVGGVGRSADGEKDFIGFELVAVVEAYPNRPSATSGAKFGHGHAGADVYSSFGQPAADVFTNERFHSGEKPRRAGQQRHFRSKSVPCRGHLYTHSPGTDHSQSWRYSAAVSRLSIGPRLRLGHAGYVWQCCGTASADGNRMAGRQDNCVVLGCRDYNPLRPFQARVAAKQFDIHSLD